MRQTRNGIRGKGLVSRNERRVSGPLRGRRGVDAGELAASELGSLTALARRLSLTPDDADEAVQRALEILLRRADSLEPPTAGAWLRTVVKHEAFAVRAERMRLMPADPADLCHVADRLDVAESADLLDRLKVASEALSRIKPGEAEALLLQAEGLSYKDIAQNRNWTYTKVNRLINEGSKAFRAQVADIDSGSACSLIPKEEGALLTRDHRRHLSRCAACRADLIAERSGVAFPGIALPALLALPAVAMRSLKHAVASFSDRLTTGAIKAQAAVEAASASKVAVVAASAAALAGGGVVAVDEVKSARHQQPTPAIARAADNPTPVGLPLSTERASGDASPPQRAEVAATAPSTVAAADAPAAEFDPGQAASAAAQPQPETKVPKGPSRARSEQSTPEFGP